MKELISLTIQNFIIIGLAVALMLIFIISNMAFSIYYNTKIVKDKFSWKKLFDGIVKMLSFVIGLSTYAIGITALPVFAVYMGLNVKAEILQAFSILATVVIFFDVTISYAKQAKETLTAILHKKPQPIFENIEAMVDEIKPEITSDD